MSEVNKLPCEWWLYTDHRNYSEKKPHHPRHDIPSIHVIEYSAYENAMAERLHFWQICVKRAEEVQALKAEVERLKDTPGGKRIYAALNEIERLRLLLKNAENYIGPVKWALLVGGK